MDRWSLRHGMDVLARQDVLPEERPQAVLVSLWHLGYGVGWRKSSALMNCGDYLPMANIVHLIT